MFLYEAWDDKPLVEAKSWFWGLFLWKKGPEDVYVNNFGAFWFPNIMPVTLLSFYGVYVKTKG